MAPHSRTGRYWVSGQANSIFQMHGHFRSPYEGTNSLHNTFETKASEIATLYLGYQLRPNSRYNTDLIVDFETPEGAASRRRWGWPERPIWTWCAIPAWVQRRISLAARFTRPSA